jgi:PhnB protein
VRGSNLSLSLNFNDADEMNKTFEALSEGGKVTMELQDTFWGARFGMLQDKFGFNWMFNHDYKK